MRATRSSSRTTLTSRLRNRTLPVGGVRAREAELEASCEHHALLVESTGAMQWEADASTLCLAHVSREASKLFGPTATASRPASLLERVHPKDRARVERVLSRFVDEADAGARLELEYRSTNAAGENLCVRSVVARAGRRLRGVSFDVTREKRLALELRQAQKLESVGRLASGIAHEINTPVQFVSDSVHFVKEAMSDLATLIDGYRAFAQAAAANGSTQVAAAEIAQRETDADLPYLLENIPSALERSLEGLERIASIVRSMKEFAHPDQRQMVEVDVNRAIDNTLTMARNEYKYVADVERDFGPIPQVTCHAGEVNQVVLNLVVNAAQAISEVSSSRDSRGVIRIRTELEGDSVVVSVSDTGGGIPEAIRDKIFDPFFTTKEVGKGTGQGLSIARGAVERHGGSITFDTTAGKGTTFFVRLPINGGGAHGTGAPEPRESPP